MLQMWLHNGCYAKQLGDSDSEALPVHDVVVDGVEGFAAVGLSEVAAGHSSRELPAEGKACC